jgi:hypothetical protein
MREPKTNLDSLIVLLRAEAGREEPRESQIIRPVLTPGKVILQTVSH